MSNSIVTQIDGELRVSSLDVAERTENEHRAVLQLVSAHLDDFEQLGHLAFEMRDGYQGHTVRVAQLNEQQATLLITYMRNSEVVRAFKLELVKQFYAMRQALAGVAPKGAELLALAIIEAQSMLTAKDEKIAELEPIAAESMTYRQSVGLRTIQDLANDLRVHVASNLPDLHFVQKDVYEQAGRLGLIIRGNTVRNNQPTAQAIKAGWVKVARTPIEHTNGTQETKVYTRLTQQGCARLWDGCLAYIREHGTLTIQKAVA